MLIIPGGDGDADTTEGLVEQFVTEYAVITYDCDFASTATNDTTA